MAMIKKQLGDKDIVIRPLGAGDLAKAGQFQKFINDLVAEKAQIKVDKKQSLKEEKAWLLKNIAKVKSKKSVILVAESHGQIIGNAGIDLGWGRRSHLGILCIAIAGDFRKMGLGRILAEETISQAKKVLKPKILRLSVYQTNASAKNFYQRLGFKQAARIKEQVSFDNKLIDEIIMLKKL